MPQPRHIYASTLHRRGRRWSRRRSPWPLAIAAVTAAAAAGGVLLDALV